MPNTFIKISTVTIGAGGQSTIDFNSIPQTYTDLKILLSVRTSASGGAGSHALYFKINTVTTNRSNKIIYGTGSSAASFGVTDPYAGAMASAGVTASSFSNHEIYIPNYTSSNNKSYSAEYAIETNATANEMGLAAGLWSSSSAITSLSFYPSTGSFDQYSTATLYGITKA